MPSKFEYCTSFLSHEKCCPSFLFMRGNTCWSFWTVFASPIMEIYIHKTHLNKIDVEKGKYFNYLFASLPSFQQPSMRREVTRYMEPGHWFLSLYNDDGDAQEVTFYAAVAEDMTQNCPNGCSGNGQCLLGHCQCNPGFGGDDCSESKCLSVTYSIRNVILIISLLLLRCLSGLMLTERWIHKWRMSM